MEIIDIAEETALELLDVYSTNNYIVGTSDMAKKLLIILREKGIAVKGFIDFTAGEIKVINTCYQVISYEGCESISIENVFEVFDVHTLIDCLKKVDVIYRIAPFVIEHALGIQSGVHNIEYLNSMIAPSASVYADFSSKIVLQNSIVYPRVKIQVYNNSFVMLKGVVIKEDAIILAENDSSIIISDGTTVGRDVEIHAYDKSSINIDRNVLMDSHITLVSLNSSKIVIGDASYLMKYVFLHSHFHSSISVGSRIIMNYYAYFISYDSEIAIGDDCLVATHVCGVVGFHSIWAHDDVEWGEKIKKKKKINVGNHVWLGMGVILLPGADINDGSMIGAGSIVNKVIPSNVCCVGDKCKVIKENIDWHV